MRAHWQLFLIAAGMNLIAAWLLFGVALPGGMPLPLAAPGCFVLCVLSLGPLLTGLRQRRLYRFST